MGQVLDEVRRCTEGGRGLAKPTSRFIFKNFWAEKLTGLIRKFGHFPIYREIQVARNDDPSLPDKSIYARRGTKQELAKMMFGYLKNKSGYDDILEIVGPIMRDFVEEEGVGAVDITEKVRLGISLPTW